ncbi:MAG: hypothetical protein PHE55_06250 [Methylococcaceae bacterium]|nr:hypothetical protein [Methylococcaceae bacterium]
MNKIQWAAMAAISLCLSGCSGTPGGLFRHYELTRMETAILGQTPRDDIIRQFGPPLEIDKRWFDSFESEIFYYYDGPSAYATLNWQPDKVLACEFSKGVLHAYVYRNLDESGGKGFDDKDRVKLVKGKTRRQEVENLFGIPDGKALLPTTMTLAALDLRLQSFSAPLASIPEGAREVWQYYRQELDDARRKISQKTLSVFFDDQGQVVASTLLQELMSKSDY